MDIVFLILLVLLSFSSARDALMNIPSGYELIHHQWEIFTDLESLLVKTSEHNLKLHHLKLSDWQSVRSSLKSEVWALRREMTRILSHSGRGSTRAKRSFLSILGVASTTEVMSLRRRAEILQTRGRKSRRNLQQLELRMERVNSLFKTAYTDSAQSIRNLARTISTLTSQFYSDELHNSFVETMQEVQELSQLLRHNIMGLTSPFPSLTRRC